MKNDGQPIRDSVPLNFLCTKDPCWLNNVFLFSTKVWAEQLKKHPVYTKTVLYWTLEGESFHESNKSSTNKSSNSI